MARPFDFAARVTHRKKVEWLRRVAAATVIVVRALIGCGLVALPGDESIPKKPTGTEVAHAGVDHALKVLQAKLSPAARGTHGKH